ncbi:hypothetical protein C7401_15420 [Paraburkholderia unamae]|nr:hypothetical protein C7401_15420 [Paraburkholderia unamae]
MSNLVPVFVARYSGNMLFDRRVLITHRRQIPHHQVTRQRAEAFQQTRHFSSLVNQWPAGHRFPVNRRLWSTEIHAAHEGHLLPAPVRRAGIAPTSSPAAPAPTRAVRAPWPYLRSRLSSAPGAGSHRSPNSASSYWFSDSPRLGQHGCAITGAQHQVGYRRKQLRHELKLDARIDAMLRCCAIVRRTRSIKLGLVLCRHGADRGTLGIG